MNKHCQVLAILAASFFVSCPAWAQQLPTQQNPGTLTPMQPPISPQDIGKPMDEIKLEVPQQVAPNRLESPRFFVRNINVEGSSLFSQEQLHALVAPYEGKEESLDELNQAVEAINQKYHDKGYLTSVAFVPPQDIENGNVTIQIREGRIGRIQLEGNHFYRARVVERNIDEAPGELLNFKTLQGDLNRSNRINDGYKLRAILKAGEEPGTTDIKLQVAERQPYQISPTFDNEGRPFICMYRWGLEARNDNVTGFGDRLYGRWIQSSGTRIFLGNYSVPLNKYGTEVSANYSYSKVNVDLNIPEPPDIMGKAVSYGLRLTQPLDRERTWTADAGVNWRSVRTFFEDDRTGNDQIRSVDIGLNYNKYDRYGRTFNRVQNTFGVGVLNGNAKFWKAEDYFTRIVNLPMRNMLILRGYGQITPDALPAAEAMQIGGVYSVHGYTEGVLIGDRGFSLGVEDRFPIPGLRKVSPWLDDRLRGAVFYDIGRVWLDKSNKQFIAGISDLPERTLLQGAGVGLRYQLSRFLQGYVDVGFGLNNRKEIEPLGQPTARISFGIRSDLLPENYMVRNNTLSPYIPQHVTLPQRRINTAFSP